MRSDTSMHAAARVHVQLRAATCSYVQLRAATCSYVHSYVQLRASYVHGYARAPARTVRILMITLNVCHPDNKSPYHP